MIETINERMLLSTKAYRINGQIFTQMLWDGILSYIDS